MEGTIAKRLRAALNMKGWSIYKLSKRLEDHPERGYSYSSLRAYMNVKNPTIPRREVLRVLASELGVSPEDLTDKPLQEGVPTHQMIDRGMLSIRFRMDGIDGERAWETPILERFPDLPWAALDTILRFLIDLRFKHDPRGEPRSFEELAAYAERFFAASPPSGSHGEQMAFVLNQAACAYLTMFGSSKEALSTEEED